MIPSYTAALGKLNSRSADVRAGSKIAVAVDTAREHAKFALVTFTFVEPSTKLSDSDVVEGFGPLIDAQADRIVGAIATFVARRATIERELMPGRRLAASAEAHWAAAKAILDATDGRVQQPSSSSSY